MLIFVESVVNTETILASLQRLDQIAALMSNKYSLEVQNDTVIHYPVGFQYTRGGKAYYAQMKLPTKNEAMPNTKNIVAWIIDR